MKTRIIWTKIYDDQWFSNLPVDLKLLFVYYFTNSRIEHTGIYQCPPRIVVFETGITQKRLNVLNKILKQESKVFFYQDWICVAKSALYGGYKGSKNELAFDRELERVPKEILKYFSDRVSIGYVYPRHTTINHKS